MMVPRGFVNPQPSTRRQSRADEDKPRKPRRPSIAARERALEESKMLAPPSPPMARSVSDNSGAVSSTPVQIPSRKGRRPTLSVATVTKSASTSNLPPDTRGLDGSTGASVKTLLATTAIPPRRKPRGRKLQRLPDCDHVAEFSNLLLEDVKARDDGISFGSFGNSHFDALFGHFTEAIDEQIIVGSVEAPSSLMSARSESSESMPSMDFIDDSATTSYNDLLSPSPSGKRTHDRRLRTLSSSEVCVEDHPLLLPDTLTPPTTPPPPETSNDMPVAQPQPTPAPAKSRNFSFRSNLTASLRALKNAAQTVSILASNPPILQPDDFLTRSIFTFAPELTDDKRPPPSDNPPSPALRRYLNPAPNVPDPSELNFWHEYPSRPNTKPTKKKKKNKNALPPTPPAVQLQTCIPSTIRSATASSPPIWLAPDGSPKNGKDALTFFAAPNLARQREPRENCDFLRILVVEMNMRRSGKFGDNMESHASVWLPARKTSDRPQMSGGDRWVDLLSVQSG